MKIIALNGSPNHDGNTAFLLKKVLETCAELGADTKMINIAEALADAKIPFCNVCSSPCNASCYKGTLLEKVFEDAAQADGLIIGSPVYFGNVSAQLKAFFDKSRRLRASKAFVGKPAGVVTCGHSRFGGQEATAGSLHHMMLVQGMTIVSDGVNYMEAGHFGVLAQAPVNEDERAIQRAEILAKRLVDTVKG